MRVLNAIADAGPQAVPGLIEALKHDQAAYWACLVLREIGPAAKDAVPALTEKLKDPRPEIRREAILALGAMEEAAGSAVPQIAAALNDEQTRQAATYALGRIGQIPADVEATVRANANSDDKVLSTTSLWAVTRVHPEDKRIRRAATKRLIERLKDKDEMVRAAAAHALTALPPAPEITGPIWEKALQDADETTVRNALSALATLGPPAVPKLIDALKYEKLRINVVYVLGQIGPAAAPATPALAKLIADKDERVAQEAVISLAKIGPAAKEAVPTLVQALQQPKSPNVYAIVYALGSIGPDAASAEPALSDLLKGSDRKLALVSAWALVQIRPAAEVSEKVVPVLTAGLSEDMPLARRGAAEALGRLGSLAKEAIPALQKATNDKDATVRDAAAKAIQAIQ
jgi:HEAT repeat protein